MTPEEADEQNDKNFRTMLLDFFMDSHKQFNGRMDEGKISLKEIMDFIDDWAKRKFK